MIEEIKSNGPIFAVLTAVWLILLALSGLIAIFVVPVHTSIKSQFILFIIDSGKVIISLFFILVWLFGWYKSMNYLLQFEFYKSSINFSPTDD